MLPCCSLLCRELHQQSNRNMYKMKRLFLIFNHQFTSDQGADARKSLGVVKIVSLPPDLQEQWSNVPPDLTRINEYLEPIRVWLHQEAKPNDYVLIQGDFGACCLMVSFSFDHDLIPVYSTTTRNVREELGPGTAVTVTHQFNHVQFRRYGA